MPDVCVFPKVWIIADKVQGSHSLSCGTVCRRLGVLPMEPKGHSWDYGIGVSTADVMFMFSTERIENKK